MKILVTFAIETEFAPWRRLHSFASVPGTVTPAYESEIGGATVRVVLTGVGPIHAKRVAAEALSWQPDVCISSGLAGALRPDLCVGDVFFALSVKELESGRTIGCSMQLIAVAQKHGIGVAEQLLSTSNMILTAEGKARLACMAEAVDMESFAVLAEALAQRVQAIAIRAISDSAEEDLPMDFQSCLNEQGNLDQSKVMRALACAPHKLPRLIRLGRNSRLAAMKLAGFLDAYVTDVARRRAPQNELVEAYQK